MDVVLRVSGELVEGGAGGDIFSPSGEVGVDGLASGEVLNSSGHGALKFLSVEFVVGSDLDVGDSGKDIKFGDVQGGEAVELVGVLDDVEVEPSALSLATGGGSVLMSDSLESLTDLVVEPGGERSSSDTGGVGLDDTDVAFEGRWGDTESSAHTTRTGAGGGDERPGTEVNIEHGGVGSLSNNTLGGVVEVLTDVVDGVDEHLVLRSIKLLGHLVELVEFLSTVELGDVELVLEPVDEGVVLLLEERPVSEISSTETDSKGLRGVSWADTHLGGADHVGFGFLESALFVHAVSQFLDTGDQVGSSRDLQSTVVVDAVVIELLELTEHAGDVHDDTVSEKVMAVLVHDTAREQVEGVLDFVDHDGVAGVGATVESGTQVVVLGEDVHEFTLTFVTPLGSEDGSEPGLFTGEAFA